MTRDSNAVITPDDMMFSMYLSTAENFQVSYTIYPFISIGSPYR